MAKRRVLTKLSISELSGVDRPCQEHAKVSIMKRAPDRQGPLDIAKVSFKEALDAQLVSQRVQNAFYGCFDNLWSRNDAFRTAMTDEIAEGGDGSVAAEAWVASVKELADNAVAAAKENGGKPTDAELAGAMDKAVATYLGKKERPTMKKFTTLAALSAAVSAFAVAKSTVQDQQDILDSAEGLGAEGIALLPADGPLAKRAPQADPAVASLQREVAVLKMAPAIRKHFDGLDANAQTAFLGKSAEAQQADVDAANATDPVVHKCADGTEIRKSDGAAVLAMAKRMDTLAQENTALKGQVGADSIAKRAAAFKHLPNPEAIVKAGDLMPEAERAGYLEAMAAADKAAAPAFKRLGGNAGGSAIEKGADSPEGQMAAIVKRFRDADPALSEAAATVKAAATPEYAEAYAASVNAQPAADAE